MKRNSKKFLALFMAVSMSITPTTVLHAEETNESDKIQSVGDQLEKTEIEDNQQDINEAVDKKEDTEKESQEDVVKETQNETEDIQSNDSVTVTQPENKVSEESEQAKETRKDEMQKNNPQKGPEQTVEEFKAEKIEAVVLNGKIQVTVSTNNQDYDKIYIGKKEAIDQTQEVKGIENSLGGFDFVFETEAENLGQKLQFVPHLKEQNEWYQEKDMYLDLPEEAQFPELLMSINGENAGINLLSAGESQNREIPAGHKTIELIDGASYSIDSSNISVTGNTMFKIVKCTITNNSGKLYARVRLSSTGFTRLYMGALNDAQNIEEREGIDSSLFLKPNVVGEGADAQNEYMIPVSALNVPIIVSTRGKKGWTGQREITFASKDMKFQGIEEGTYEYKQGDPQNQFRVVTDNGESSMFKIHACTIKKNEAGMVAEFTMSGSGYSKLYLGSANDAAKGENIITPVRKVTENNKEKNVYQINVTSLNTPIQVAGWGKKSGWTNHTITFNFDTNTIDAGEEESNPENPGTGSSGNQGGTGGPGNNTGSSSGTNTGNSGSQNGNNSDNQFGSNTNGTTSRVNTSTKLADGTYKPDGFLWTGGTGKVSITCSQITISGGQAYATITFSSPHYSYVKANGSKYTPVSTAGGSTFIIPVELNKNNKIIGNTTAMSQDHEITYSIFVYLSAAQNAEGSTVIGAGMASENKKLDQEAPSIIGLEYQGEVELKHAEYFKIYEYEQGIKLLEIDLASGTPREEQESDVEEEQTVEMTQSGRVETKSVDQSKTDEAQTDEDTKEQSEQEDKTELYMNNIVKYLIVPEDVEIPVGLDKETIVIQQPTDKAYVASDVILDKLEQLETLDKVKAVANAEKDCTNETIKNALKEKKVDCVGTYDEPDFKQLVKDTCNLAVLDNAILPEDEPEAQTTLDEQLSKMKEILGKYDTLNIPVFIDRSSDEKDELAQAEWMKVYGTIFGCEDKAEEIYAELTK